MFTSARNVTGDSYDREKAIRARARQCEKVKNSKEERNKVQRGCVLEKGTARVRERERERRDAVPRRELKREGSEAREKLSNVARVWNDSRSVPAFSKFSKSLPACAFERLSSHYFSLARPSASAWPCSSAWYFV